MQPKRLSDKKARSESLKKVATLNKNHGINCKLAIFIKLNNFGTKEMPDYEPAVASVDGNKIDSDWFGDDCKTSFIRANSLFEDDDLTRPLQLGVLDRFVKIQHPIMQAMKRAEMEEIKEDAEGDITVLSEALNKIEEKYKSYPIGKTDAYIWTEGISVDIAESQKKISKKSVIKLMGDKADAVLDAIRGGDYYVDTENDILEVRLDVGTGSLMKAYNKDFTFIQNVEASFQSLYPEFYGDIINKVKRLDTSEKGMQSRSFHARKYSEEECKELLTKFLKKAKKTSGNFTNLTSDEKKQLANHQSELEFFNLDIKGDEEFNRLIEEARRKKQLADEQEKKEVVKEEEVSSETSESSEETGENESSDLTENDKGNKEKEDRGTPPGFDVE